MVYVDEERLKPILNSITQGGILTQLDEDEVKQVLLDFNVDPNNYEKVIRTMVYIRQRFVFKKTRYEAFKIAFPHRVRDDMARTTIETKAKRVEEYKIYKKLVATLQASLYVSYAMERIEVLDLALEKIRSFKTKDRDKIEYMKLFLQETRKPTDLAKELEVNVNVQNNNISINRIEAKMQEIGSKLDGMSADKVLEVLDGN